MKYILGFLILFNTIFLAAQEKRMVFDTIFYSNDSTFTLLDPDFQLGKECFYEIINYDFRVKNGDTISNKNKVSKFSYIPLSMDKEGIEIEIKLEDSYWKQIVLYDSIYSSFNIDSIPKIQLKYQFDDLNFSIQNHEIIGDYFHRHIEEAKSFIDADTSSDSWDRKIASACLEKCQDSTVIRNWVTYSNGAYTLFSYYSFLFPLGNQIKYEINQALDDFSLSTYFIVNKQLLNNGDMKYLIFEDTSRGKNSSDRMFDDMVNAYSKLDTEANADLYSSETQDSTYVIVSPAGFVLEATTKSSDKTLMKSGVSESRSIYSVRRVDR